ncbi:MAG TPA: protein translocase subunit SecF [Nitrospiria bacterium]|nr:protein translocase subunit SecF [Nitrospiria bacterium]
MFELFGKTQIDFVGRRYIFFALSGVLVSLGLLALVQISRGAANLGIDFAGGAAVQLKFSQPVRINDARKLLDENGIKDAELQEFTEGDKLLIRMKNQEITGRLSDRLMAIFTKAFPGNSPVVESSTEIGPTIGEKLRQNAMVAVAISVVAIIIYIAMRFELRFGIAATAATFHDVLAVLGMFYLMNKEINLLVVTALLTLAGYSLTDTVVVFDRIRENLRTRRKERLEEIINAGINQVLSRTAVVSLTVFLVLVALFFWGGEVIHDFALALILGIIVGTYSSWFVASPLLLLFKKSQGRLLKRA